MNHAQTTVSGANWVTLASGRDTNLYGAEVSGGGITAQVARNLNIVSDQDTETQTASLTSWSFSATIGLYGSPSSLSASYAKGDAYGNYASVTTTSGLFAGSSGYAVTVGGTTTLTAAALGSTASASQNSLTTGALVTQNLTNSMNWKASYWGFSFSASTAGMGGVQPGLSQKQTGSSSGLAQATIAPGGVTILNAALQKSLTGKTPDQIVAALNRSATAQNKAANTLPGGLQQTLQNQADRSNALMAASASTAKLVGDVSSMLKASADQTVATLGPKEQNGTITPEEQQQLDAARLQASLWGEDGAARILVHGATQGVLAWLGGGFSLDAGLRGAGGAIFAAVLAPLLTKEAQKLLDSAGLGDPQTRAVLANLIGELAVTGIGSAFGNMGAVTAASVTINNYLTHKNVADLKEELQKALDECNAKPEGCSTDDQLSIMQGLINKYQQISNDNDRALIAQCATTQCAQAILDKDMATFGELQSLFGGYRPEFLQYLIYSNMTNISAAAARTIEIKEDYISGYADYSQAKCAGLSAAACLQGYSDAYNKYLNDIASVQYAKFALATVTLGVAVAPEVASYCLANPYSCTATVNAAGDMVLCVSTNTCGTLTAGTGALAKEAAAALEEKLAAGVAEAKVAADAAAVDAASVKSKLGDFLDQADLDRLAQIRNDLGLTSNNALSRNVAYAEGYVDGADIGEIVGVSGQKGPGVAMPESRVFTTGVDQYPRDLDLEVFVLENLAQKLSPNSSGTVVLISERPFCDSCSNVIAQFQAMFPNITLILRSGVPK